LYIFLDESGCLGFDFENKSPSKKFVITLLVCNDRKTVDSFKSAVKRTLKNKLNRKSKRSRVVEELHATHITQEIKEYFLRQVKSDGWYVYTVALNKLRVEQHLQSRQGKKKLYNYLSRFILEKVDFSGVTNTVTLVVDKSKNKAEIADFNGYLSNQLEAKLELNVRLNIDHLDSKASAGLQAVDSFCWGVYRKYEHKDDAWYRCYAHKIAFETEYLKNQA